MELVDEIITAARAKHPRAIRISLQTEGAWSWLADDEPQVSSTIIKPGFRLVVFYTLGIPIIYLSDTMTGLLAKVRTTPQNI